jgi:hypothetical protein
MLKFFQQKTLVRAIYLPLHTSIAPPFGEKNLVNLREENTTSSLYDVIKHDRLYFP